MYFYFKYFCKILYFDLFYSAKSLDFTESITFYTKCYVEKGVLMDIRMNQRLQHFAVAQRFVADTSGVGGVNKPANNIITPEELDKINERLGNGDKTALEELDKYNIPYTMMEISNGYTIKYSYNNNNYMVTYRTSNQPNNYTLDDLPDVKNKIDEYFVKFAEREDLKPLETIADIDKPEDPETVDEPEVPEEPSVPAEPEETEEPDYEFDYTSAGVDANVEAETFYNEDDANIDGLSTLMDIFSSVDTDVDSGGWDDLFAELEKMKPQLKEYMKQQLEAYGYVFDEKTADIVLNTMITDAVEILTQDLKDDDLKENGRYYKMGGGAGREPLKTIEDIVNYIKDRIDLSPEKQEGDYFTAVADKFQVNNEYVNLFEPASDNEAGLYIENGRTSKYISEDRYLLDTADYFLTDEEKELKNILEIVEGRFVSQPVVKTKEDAAGYIDKYANHLHKVFANRYGGGSGVMPMELEMRMKLLVASFKTSKIPEPNELGLISIKDVLQAFKDYMYEEMAKADSELRQNS